MVATTGMGTDGRQADSLDNDQLSVLAMTDALAQLGPLRTVLGDLVARLRGTRLSSGTRLRGTWLPWAWRCTPWALLWLQDDVRAHWREHLRLL